MPSRNDWTRPQVLAALHLYHLLPFGKLDRNTPQVKQLGSWLGRTASAVALKLVNLASLDPAVIASGRVGMRGSSALDQQIWRELVANWDKTALEAAAHYVQLAAQNPASAQVQPIAINQNGVSGRVTKTARPHAGMSRRSALTTVQLRPPNLGTANVYGKRRIAPKSPGSATSRNSWSVA